ncbi:MAG: DUF4097 family beta strand repeat protein [Clostridiaceae bacterium]|nr:DUF4097 family beta strand repeat protein [Clostridiaceae bacterium]
MNRSEYLMALYDALDGIPTQERTDAISEYREYFISEIEKGRTEDEICVSLGDPITLAYAIKQRRGYGANKQETFYEKPRRTHGVFRKVASAVTVTVILFTVLGGSLMFNISKGSGLIFGFGKKYEINDIRETDLDSANTIIVRTTSANTSILPSDNRKIETSLVGNVRSTSPDYVPKLEITKSGDTIIIEEKRKGFAIIGFNWENVNLDISIPKSFKGDIRYEGTSGDFDSSDLDIDNFIFRLSSGNARLDNITLKNDLDFTSTSGDITIDRLKARNFTLQSSSGNKKLSDISVKDKFNINSTSGDTELKGINSDELRIDSTSGVINIDGIKLELLSVESKSGNVNVDDFEGSAQIEVTSGNIKLSVDEAKKEIYLKASSGNVELEMPSNTGFTLDSKFSSGNIKCDFDLDDKDSGDHKLRGRYRGGNIPVNINTTSGNIEIEKR